MIRCIIFMTQNHPLYGGYQKAYSYEQIKKVDCSKLAISKYENLKNGESNMKYVLDRILKN